MNKQAFKQLLKRYIDDTATAQERQLVDYWFESLVVENEEVITSSNTEDWEKLEAKLWDKIQMQTEEKPMVEKIEKTTILRTVWHNNTMRWGIAASIALLLGIGLYFLVQYYAPNQALVSYSSDEIVTLNTSKKIQNIRLEDGSKVRLYPQSKLVYPSQFTAEKREVRLEGEAFFEVSHQPHKPFFVIANEVVTKVLGTSFYIKANKNTKVEVAVKTGKVAVSEQTPHNIRDNGVVLTPNQKVIYYTEDKHFVTGIVEKPEVLSTEKEIVSFDFKNTTLAQVCQSLKKSYGIEIVLESEAISACNLTGDLTKMDMYQQLDVICQSIGATYQVKGTTILISGKGCLP